MDELAALLEGAVGCSRAVTNQGWRPHAEQIGQTGVRIAPDLYIACGISGDFYHYFATQEAKFVVAINKNPVASIFKVADLGIVGDPKEVIPPLLAELSG